MSSESNIILVTNDNNVAKTLKPKPVLLRKIDNILITTYSEALVKIKKIHPELVLVYCAEEKESCLELIKTIKTDEAIKETAIFLILKKYDQDFILSAYDEDITDYITLDSSDADILIRIMWSLKKRLMNTTVIKQKNLLKELGVIDKNTGFYTNEYCNKVFDNEIQNIKKAKIEAVFMLVSASEESKLKLNPNDLAKAIKSSTRELDIISHSSANRFYIMLKETSLKGAFCVFEKIKQLIGEDYTINAGVSFVNKKSFEELKTQLLNALVEAISTKQELVIVNEEEEKIISQDWLEKINSTQKNFKLFKQAFNKKLDRVIAPVFFQMQKIYEEKLFQTEIEQYSNSTSSVFILKKGDKISELKITYPGFSKINIDIMHQGLDSPENKKINLGLKELNQEKLEQVLEDFIHEFKINTNE